MATAAELTGEEIAAVAESLSDPANLNVDTMAAIMHRCVEMQISYRNLKLISLQNSSILP